MNSVLKDGAPRVDEFQRHLSTSVRLAGLAIHGWIEIIGRTWQIIECYCTSTTFRSSTSEARELLKVFILFLNYFVKFIPYNTMATTPRMRKANEKSAKVRIFLVKPLRMLDTFSIVNTTAFLKKSLKVNIWIFTIIFYCCNF